MGKIRIISIIIALIFSMPIILSNFVYLRITDGSTYFFIYFLLMIYYVLSYIKKKKTFLEPKAVLTILFIMFIINITIIGLHNKSEFIIGANYNKFNSEKWQKADFDDSDLREYMLKDLAQNILPNKNLEEVRILLGDPQGIIAENIIYYRVAPNGSDYKTLNIYFDENGIFKEYKLALS